MKGGKIASGQGATSKIKTRLKKKKKKRHFILQEPEVRVDQLK